MIRLLGVWLSIIMIVLTGCNGQQAEDPPPEPVELLTESAQKIRAADTFRMEVRHSGADYLVSVYLTDDVPVDVAFRRATAQYVAPSEMQARVRIVTGELAMDVDVYASGEEQWVRFTGTGWLDNDFAPGFNPETLIAEERGFQAALASLTDLEYVGTDSLEDGTEVYHLSGTAEGPAVTDLLVGLIEAEGLVPVDAYISRETIYPARLVIRQPETVTEEEPVPTTWTIDVYDINAEPELTPPEGATLP